MTTHFFQGHALLIGVGSHKYHSHLDVPITVADAQAVESVLQNRDLCGYPQEQVTLLRNSQTTTEGVLQALDNLSQLGTDQTVFLFFAGHGALGTDGRYYLLTHDVKLTGNKVAAGTGLSEELLLEKLRAIPAKRCLMLFNACHSAHIGPGTLAPEAALPTLNPSGKTAHALLGTGEGRILIVAARKEQYSYFVPGANTTFFTKKLVEGLEGEAAANGGYIGVFGLYEYLYHEVKEAVQAQYGEVQEPVLTAVQTVGSFPVSLYRGAMSLGVFVDDLEGLEGTAIEQITADKAARTLRQTIKIDTGGGAYIGGNVHTGGGTFVGRDMSVSGDYVRGDKVGGDKIGGDKITVSDGGAVAKGDGATAVGERGVYVSGNVGGHIITGNSNQISQGSDPNEIAAAFATIQAALVTAKLTPDQKMVAETAVAHLQTEAQKGEQAEETVVQGWLTKLLQMSEDIGEVTIQTFLNPISGLATVFKKVAQKAREQQETKKSQ
jgi:hypothetical protein